ncbi:hypothetical protein D3C80_1618290 [compost metagenome]
MRSHPFLYSVQKLQVFWLIQVFGAPLHLSLSGVPQTLIRFEFCHAAAFQACPLVFVFAL